MSHLSSHNVLSSKTEQRCHLITRAEGEGGPATGSQGDARLAWENSSIQRSIGFSA